MSFKLFYSPGMRMPPLTELQPGPSKHFLEEASTLAGKDLNKHYRDLQQLKATPLG